MKAKLKDLFLFNDLCDDTIQEIENITTELVLPRDSIVFYEGDESKDMFFIIKGDCVMDILEHDR